MAVRDKILDGLAWASLSEPARVARISIALVKELGTYTREHTKTRVKEAVRNTSPPYGRAKFVVEAVEKEYRRQLPIHRERQERHKAWKDYLTHMAKRSTRLNNAYAASFSRPPYMASRSYPGEYSDWDARRDWEEAERARDKGDECTGMTHQDGYVVALVSSESGATKWHIATRLKSGPIVKTYLRANLTSGGPQNLAEAAVSLGGPKVKAALARGKKVVTDWIGRKTYIHHEGQDHHAHGVETLNWRIVTYVERPGYAGRMTTTAVAADLIDGREVETDSHTPYQWNDTD
jgi:hypothetical protein